METKTVWRFFTIAQWEEENKWLNQMEQNGWHLVRINFLLRYVFEKGSKGEYIYKLDLPDNIEYRDNELSYRDFLTECGIDIVCEQKQWLYLRKKSSDGPFDKKDDLFSKLIMCNKAYSYAIDTLTKLLRYFAILLVLFILALNILDQPTIKNILKGMIMGVGIGAIWSIAIIWVPLLNNLRKKMNKLVSEIAIKH